MLERMRVFWRKTRSFARMMKLLLQTVQSVEHLHNQIAMTRKRVDLMNSRSEVSMEWFEEFMRWKETHALPTDPLVSVCVPTYNRAKLLTERCLPSILGQSYQRLEVIVVGDHCTDATEQRVSAISDPRLRFVNLPCRGPYPLDPARQWLVAGTAPGNHAIELAQGAFITHLDDDDAYAPDRLEKLVNFALKNRLDFVWHPFWFELEPGCWRINEARDFDQGQVTTSSVFYHAWFKRFRWDIQAHLLGEPGDWNMFRKIKYLNPASQRYPEPLLYHYREESQSAAA